MIGMVKVLEANLRQQHGHLDLGEDQQLPSCV